MSLPVKIREFLFPADYEGALHLWQAMEAGVVVGRSDTPAEIQRKLERDPDLFLVAEENHRIVGTIIGGYDGRRGLIYHLAVDAAYRHQGIAGQLMTEVEKRLHAKGCVKSYLLVFADNMAAIEFYKHQGWREQTDIRLFGKEF